MPKTLVITNDFPPRVGGIESFVAAACRLLDDQVVVLTSHSEGDGGHDRTLPFPVVRHGHVLLPTRHVGELAADLLDDHGCDRVLFGAAAPLGLLAPRLRRAGAQRIVALTHGHEVWWARVPLARRQLRRIGDAVDRLSTISDFTAARIAPALSPAARRRMIMIPPPVDPVFWRRNPAGSAPSGGRPRCVAVARFVRQKNLATLLAAWNSVCAGPAAVDAELVLVGDGPQRHRLERQVRRLGLGASVRFTGTLLAADVRAELDGARLFALPVRTRWGGLNPEGLGLVFAEAAAAGLPVIVGDSGGAPETVRDGVSGFVVDPDDVAGLAGRIRQLLADPGLAAQMGADGHDHVAGRFGPELIGERLRDALGLSPAAGRSVG